MKKILSLFALSFILLFSVVGCAPEKNINSKNNNSPTTNIESSSTPQVTESSQIPPSSTDAKITREDAKSIALNHAGVTDTEIYDYEIDLDFENGILVYEITFEKDATEYDYHINASDGTILKSNKELDY